MVTDPTRVARIQGCCGTLESSAAAGELPSDPTGSFVDPDAPPDHHSLAPCSPPSRPLRAASGGGLRPALTAAARGAIRNRGQDGETVPRSNRETGQQKQATRKTSCRPKKPLDLKSPIQGWAKARQRRAHAATPVEVAIRATYARFKLSETSAWPERVGTLRF